MKEKNVKHIHKLRGQLRDLAFERLGILAYAIRFGGVAASDIIKGELIKTNFVRKMWANADARKNARLQSCLAWVFPKKTSLP